MSRRVTLTKDELYTLRELIQEQLNLQIPYHPAMRIGNESLVRLKAKLDIKQENQ